MTNHESEAKSASETARPTKARRRWTWRRIAKWSFPVALLVLLAPYGWSRFHADANRIQTFETESAPAHDGQPPSSLTIMSFNIAHGRGIADSNWTEGGDKKRARIREIADYLKLVDADVVVLNEVDFNSVWSGGQNQAEAIASEAGYRYRVEQRNLDFSIGWKSLKFGNAILSRFPITETQEVDYPAEKDWENWLVGIKRGVLAEIDLGQGQTFHLGAVHLEHRSESTRVASIQSWLDVIAPIDGPIVLAGDFNSSPIGFPRISLTAHNRTAVQTLLDSGPWQHRPENRPSRSEYTFRSHSPTSVIDWIMVNSDTVAVTNYRVADIQLSDHRPVIAELSWSDDGE